ncbi:MAG: hypothetical protein J6I98_04480 [Clostridia bacterium]|nr:hypothetical protein [Clostridia bacterium]
MQLFHGSRTGGITILEPRLADHDRPYVYMTTNEIVALFYLCNAVEKPYYWFPYGFNQDGVPVYHELYPNALREVSEGVSGYIYEVDAGEEQVIPFKNIPVARLATQPIPVENCRTVENAYDLLMEYVRRGELIIDRFEDKTPERLDWWYNALCGELQQKNMRDKPDCSYARFIQKKLPMVWERYLKMSE